MNPSSNFFSWGSGGGQGAGNREGARVSVVFFTKNPNLIKKIFSGRGVGGREGEGGIGVSEFFLQRIQI